MKILLESVIHLSFLVKQFVAVLLLPNYANKPRATTATEIKARNVTKFTTILSIMMA
jgi:hypothetical protein